MIIIILLCLILSLCIFSGFVALGTYLIKRTWLSQKARIQKIEIDYKTIERFQNKENVKYSPTGWIWNEETQLWDPPKEKNQIRISRNGPSYEEWKAAKEQENSRCQEKTEQSTYHYTKSELAKDETTIYKKPTITYEPKVDRTKTNYQPKPQEKPIPSTQTAEFQDAYEAVNIFTRNESENYKKLKIAADRKGYIICPKVRLADIVKPRNDPQYMSRFGKIKSKHVDFVIYDGEMRHLKAVIELDDSSHDRKDRKERDEFVDFILNDCGYRVIHTRYITTDILDDV